MYLALAYLLIPCALAGAWSWEISANRGSLLGSLLGSFFFILLSIAECLVGRRLEKDQVGRIYPGSNVYTNLDTGAVVMTLGGAGVIAGIVLSILSFKYYFEESHGFSYQRLNKAWSIVGRYDCPNEIPEWYKKIKSPSFPFIFFDSSPHNIRLEINKQNESNIGIPGIFSENIIFSKKKVAGTMEGMFCFQPQDNPEYKNWTNSSNALLIIEGDVISDSLILLNLQIEGCKWLQNCRGKMKVYPFGNSPP